MEDSEEVSISSSKVSDASTEVPISGDPEGKVTEPKVSSRAKMPSQQGSPAPRGNTSPQAKADVSTPPRGGLLLQRPVAVPETSPGPFVPRAQERMSAPPSIPNWSYVPSTATQTSRFIGSQPNVATLRASSALPEDAGPDSSPHRELAHPAERTSASSSSPSRRFSSRGERQREASRARKAREEEAEQAAARRLSLKLQAQSLREEQLSRRQDRALRLAELSLLKSSSVSSKRTPSLSINISPRATSSKASGAALHGRERDAAALQGSVLGLQEKVLRLEQLVQRNSTSPPSRDRGESQEKEAAALREEARRLHEALQKARHRKGRASAALDAEDRIRGRKELQRSRLQNEQLRAQLRGFQRSLATQEQRGGSPNRPDGRGGEEATSPRSVDSRERQQHAAPSEASEDHGRQPVHDSLPVREPRASRAPSEDPQSAPGRIATGPVHESLSSRNEGGMRVASEDGKKRRHSLYKVHREDARSPVKHVRLVRLVAPRRKSEIGRRGLPVHRLQSLHNALRQSPFNEGSSLRRMSEEAS